MRVCRDGGGVRTLLTQLAAGSNAVHEVSHGVLFTTKLVRSGGEDVQVVLSITAVMLASNHRPNVRRDSCLIKNLVFLNELMLDERMNE